MTSVLIITILMIVILIIIVVILASRPRKKKQATPKRCLFLETKRGMTIYVLPLRLP